MQLLQCIATEEEPDSCYILTPIYLKPLDILTFLNPDKLKNVTHFELKAFTNLQTIPNVILDTFPQLEELVFGGFSFINTLTFTDFAHAANLKTLDLKANELTTIPYSVFSLATNLENLDLSFNTITTIEDLAFNGLAQLQKLDLSYNKLSTLTHFAFSGIQNLEYLDLSHNKIKLLENGALYLPSLTHLYLGSNDFKLLPDGLFGIGPSLTSALTVVDLSENKLTHIGQSIYNLKQLTWLNLTSNKNIDDLNLNGFAGMENLEELYLSNTGFAPAALPLITLGGPAPAAPSSQSNVKILHIAKNKIANPDFLRQLAVFGKLEELNIENNKIIYIDGISQIQTWFPNLKTIEIGGNKLNCVWLNESVPLFEAAKINVFTVKKTKTWFTGTTLEKKLIDTTDCVDLETIFNNILTYITTFGRMV